MKRTRADWLLVGVLIFSGVVVFWALFSGLIVKAVTGEP